MRATSTSPPCSPSTRTRCSSGVAGTGTTDADYAELSQRPEIRASIEKLMAKANAKLERWETVKRFAILDHEFGVDDGGDHRQHEGAPRPVTESYADVVDALYPNEDRSEE